MTGTREVLVQRDQSAVGVVAQIALVRIPVPRSFSRVVGRFLGCAAVGDHAGGIGDDIILVELADETIDHLAIHSRLTAARLEVEDHGGTANKGLGAKKTTDVFGTVQRGVEVGIEVAGGLKFPLACGTIVMKLGLAIMLTQTKIVPEKTAAASTVVVLLIVVFDQGRARAKMRVASLAVVMLRALDVMLFEPCGRFEIFLTRKADVMALRVVPVLFEGITMGEISFAAVAEGHRVVIFYDSMEESVNVEA